MLKVNNPRMLKMNGLFADFETSTQFELEIYRVTVNFQIAVFKTYLKFSCPFSCSTSVYQKLAFLSRKIQNRTQNRTEHGNLDLLQNRTEQNTD